MLTLDDARLVSHLHGGFPLTERPFAEVAHTLALDESQVLERLGRLLARGALTRFGPLFQIERAGGLFVLAALAVPEHRFEAVTAQVNAHLEVAHNYRRSHALNMWFVVGAETPEAARHVLAAIEAETGLPVYAFPKEREFFVELKLPLLPPEAQAHPLAPLPTPQPTPAPTASPAPASPTEALDALDRALITATQTGLPLVARPYEAVGAMLGVSSQQVRERLARMLASGLIRRIGAVPHHVRLGFVANGMSVWNVDDAQVDALGEQVGALPGVSHCYRRPRRLPLWPYNLFAMLHGRRQDDVQAQAAQIAQLLGPACHGHDILYSTAVLKKTGLRLKE